MQVSSFRWRDKLQRMVPLGVRDARGSVTPATYANRSLAVAAQRGLCRRRIKPDETARSQLKKPSVSN
jgi:hypothetical protein